MSLIKRTFVLPSETLQEFEQVVSPEERNKVIAEALRDWLDKQKLREAIIEGLHDMADLLLEIEAEYHPLEEEAYYALEN
jgi:metal-responsive CopG/Arc/MetJ family transcriptional regulator